MLHRVEEKESDPLLLVFFPECKVQNPDVASGVLVDHRLHFGSQNASDNQLSGHGDHRFPFPSPASHPSHLLPCR